MRFIDLNLVIAWPELQALRDAAEAARVAVSAIDDADTRRDFIRRHHAVWTGFRPLFESVFGAKCWYTESANPGTDDDIDHFRPKGAIAEREDHGGYWWEAFNWMNLRLSCHRANRLRVNPETGTTHGKGNHFPLLTEDERWMTQQSRIMSALPCLIQPIPLIPRLCRSARTDVWRCQPPTRIARRLRHASRSAGSICTLTGLVSFPIVATCT